MRYPSFPILMKPGLPARRPIFLAIWLAALVVAAPAVGATGEDSLLCAKVKDPVAASGWTAAFWPYSQRYGDMTWCNMKVRAVEHCVSVVPVMYSTDAPYEEHSGQDLPAEYTCYRIRCTNGEGRHYLGSSVRIRDRFGVRMAGKPQVTRVCLPNW